MKLRADRQRPTEEVISELRRKFLVALPGIEWEFPGILSDLVGDLTWSPEPIEVKLFSTDIEFLKRKAPEVQAQLDQISGVVDTFDGLVYAGPSLSLQVRHTDARALRPHGRGRRRGGQYRDARAAGLDRAARATAW